MKSLTLTTLLLLSFFISQAQNISQSQVRQFNAVPAYRVFGRGSGVGTPSFLQLDSNWIPALHSQSYYDLRYGLLSTQNGKLNSNFGTPGSILFRGATGISQNNSKFFYDSANNRVGLGTITPRGALEIISSDAFGVISSKSIPSNGFEGLNMYDDKDSVAASFSHSNSAANTFPASTWGAARVYGEPFHIAINDSASSRNSFQYLHPKISVTSPNGFVGINNVSPTEQLHVKGRLRIDTVPTGTTTDSVAVVRNGVIYKVPQSAIAGGSGTAVDTIPLHNQIVANTTNIATNTTNITANMQPIWKRKGVVMVASKTADQDNVYEPTVLIEGSPQILTSATSVFKMWYTSGWTNGGNINYAESVDGINWTQYSGNPIITNHCRNNVIKSGSTYVMYVALTASGTQIDRYTSTNGTTWTLANSAVVTLGSAGSWNAGSLHNSFVLIEGGVWKMIIEGRNTTGPYSLGYYTSSDGITWTPYAGNPVLTGISPGGPFLAKVGSTYWLWCHGSGGSNILPSDVYRYSSTNLTSWTAQGGIVLPRRETDEGANNPNGQLADPFLVSVGNSTYMYYEGATDGSVQAGASRLKLAIADVPISTLVTTSEGDNGSVGYSTLAPTNFATATVTGDVSAANVYASSKMGIGTTGPTYDFDLTKTATGAVVGRIQNLSTGTGASANLYLSNSASNFALSKYSTTATAYKTISSSDAALYNSTGNITILNDNASGNINFAAGAGSSAQVILGTAGHLNVVNRLGVGSTTVPSFPLEINGITKSNGSFVSQGTDAYFSLGYNTYYNAGWKNIASAETGMFFRGDANTMTIYSATSGVTPTPTLKGGWTTNADIFYNIGKIGAGLTTPTSTLQTTSFAAGYVAKTAAYTATISDYTIDCNGTFTVTLPTAVGITGRIYIIKNSGTGTITLAGTSAQTFDGAASPTIATQYGLIRIQSNGANWLIL